jgi:UDP-N-acetylmuramyl pentapeptide phosphotransferase/UDP-N-acetylglucosamine-1-phosphate transferase
LLSGNTSQATLLFLLASAVAGFIVFNMRSPWRSRASVFMGDSGSMMLGFATAWFAIDLTQQASGAFTPITAVWILGIPIFDTVSIMLRRVFLGRSPFSPDHGHLHHILLRIGFSVPQTVVLIILLSIAFGLAGISAHYFGLPEYMMFYSFIILFLGYFVITLYAWKLTMPTEESCATQFGPEA